MGYKPKVDISIHLHKQYDSCVGHGIGKAQDSTAHDGITQVKWRHSKRGVARMLEEKGTHYKQISTREWGSFGLFLFSHYLYWRRL